VAETTCDDHAGRSLAFNQTFATGVAGWLAPTSYMNPRVFRLNGEFAF
jgi:hypothetical protein